MNDSASLWYEATTPSLPDSKGATIVGYKSVEVRTGKALQFTILRQANGDFIINCDQASLTAAYLAYRPCTIYAAQAQAMPAQVIWSIILEGVQDI